jgi:hypothetical protein
MAKKEKEKKCHFPTNARCGMRFSPTPDDLLALAWESSNVEHSTPVSISVPHHH